MTSTEFTIGMGDGRNSSKVLKPPGGGSSNIFGGLNYAASPPKKQNGESNLRPASPQPAGVKTPAKSANSDIFFIEETNVPKKNPRKYVHRNPITGEVVEINLDKNNEESDNESNSSDKNICNGEAPAEDVPKPVKPTSVRVRQPPGGKSSGIF